MDICNHGHDEVCYDGFTCPVCEMEEKKDEEIEKLENKISELESELEETK